MTKVQNPTYLFEFKIKSNNSKWILNQCEGKKFNLEEILKSIF